MDPGESYLKRLKGVPNLIDEDPSIISPSQQKNYLDMSWQEFNNLLKERAEKLQKQQQPEGGKESSSKRRQPSLPENAAISNQREPEANWDSGTGYQDEDHVPHH